MGRRLRHGEQVEAIAGEKRGLFVNGAGPFQDIAGPDILELQKDGDRTIGRKGLVAVVAMAQVELVRRRLLELLGGRGGF